MTEIIERIGQLLSAWGGLTLSAYIVVILLLLESLFPAFPSRGRLIPRWIANSLLYVLGMLVYYLAQLGVGLLVLHTTAQSGFGLFNTWTTALPVQLLVVMLALDGVSYLVHRAMHRFTPLWRVHLVHHSDLDVDLSTSLRHHPLEILLLGATQAFTVFLLACDPAVLMIAYALLLFWSFWQHVNLRLPEIPERALQWLLVTPGFHRVHHSARRVETDSNFGHMLSIWDRLAGTLEYRPRPELAGLTLGLDYFREPGDQSVYSLLTQPFRFEQHKRR